MKGYWVFSILSLLVPLLYLSMYLPIWNGKGLSLANPGVLPLILFIFQCICVIFAILRLVIVNLRNSDNCLMTFVSGFFFVCSLVLTCFFGFIFMLELFNIPWFPAQQ